MVKSQKKEQPAIEAICNMKITEQNITKGCGKEIYSDSRQELHCGYKEQLCLQCKSKLQGYQLAQKETAEKVEKWFWKHHSRNFIQESHLKELKEIFKEKTGAE
jgi:hypothetical protein